ncbi:hypothetical protein [Fibrobacter sp. UBA4297]|uniref:hypothetical protein n=1 Tax=Fibrobacter sp. UBA4297 TaxID=1946536 RepID=UPI0025B9CAD0|nr:hypothetical protein [Fibrobacter sp. UBA4297]
MKKLHQYMMILVAGVLSACGSMSVNDPYLEALPEGFSAMEYMALHPELRIRQVKDYVADFNAQVKATLGNAAYNEQKKAEDEAFSLNPDLLGALYTNPLIGGHSPQEWNALIVNMSSPDTLLSKEAKLIYAGLVDFNMVTVLDEAALLAAVPVDEVAITQQFNIFGRTHGWAYRNCRPEEANNTPRDSLPIIKAQLTMATSADGFTPDTGLYCRDAAGVDRLIQ